jgi:hypothetical protein
VPPPVEGNGSRKAPPATTSSSVPLSSVSPAEVSIFLLLIMAASLRVLGDYAENNETRVTVEASIFYYSSRGLTPDVFG